MTTRVSARTILGLGAPALGALAADPVLSLVDTAFVGRIGAEPLAALGIDAAIFGFAFAAFNFLAYATTPLVARARGKADMAEAAAVVRQAHTLAVVIGLGALGVLVVAAPLLVGLFDPEPAVVEPAITYLRIRALATPAFLVVTAGHGSFRGLQDTRTPMYITLAVNLVNAVLDPLLMFGAGWGLAGAAIATLAAQWIGAGAFVVLLARRAAGEGWRLGLTRLGETRALLRVGWVLILRTMLLVASLGVATGVASRIGTVEVAAHQIVSQVWFLLAMIVDAVAIAAQVLVADQAGRSGVPSVRPLADQLHRWGLAAGVVLAGAVWLAGGLVASLSTDQHVREAVLTVVPIAAAMQPVAALLFVSDGVYMALVEMRRLAWSTGAGFLATLAVGGATLALGWGLAGVWWAMSAMVASRFLVLAAGYRSMFSDVSA